MTDGDFPMQLDSPDGAIRRTIAFVVADARANAGQAPPWPEIRERVAWDYVPDTVAALIETACGHAAGGGPSIALALLERESPADANIEIPLLAAALARAAGGDPEVWMSLARERFVELFRSARQLIEAGQPLQGLSILLRQAPFASLMVEDPAQRPLASARLLSLIGSALDDVSRYPLSEQAYLACLELLDPAVEQHLPERAKTLSNLGALHQLDGQFEKSSRLLDDAVAAFERLAAGEEATYGLAAALINRGHSANYRGRPAAAEADWRRAIALSAAVSVYHDAMAAEAAIHLAAQQFDREAWHDGLDTLRQGWQAALRAGDGARRGEMVALAAQAALRACLDTRARRLFALARERFEALLPNHLADYLDTLRGEARALGYGGTFEEAKAVAGRALAEGSEALGALHEQNLRTRAQLADLCWDAGAYAEGQLWAERARDDARALFPPDHPTNLMQESRFAEFLLVEGRSAEAIGILLDCLAREPLLTGRLIDGHSDLVDLAAIRTAKSQLDLATLAALRMTPSDPDLVMRLTDSRLHFGGSGLALLAARRSGQDLPGALGPALIESADSRSHTLIATTTLYREAGVERRALALWDRSGCTLHDLGPAEDLDLALARWSRAPWRPAGPAVELLLDFIHGQAGSPDRLLWFPDNALALVPLAALFTRRHPPVMECFAIVQSRDAYAALAPAAPLTGGVLLVGISEFRGRDGRDHERPLPSVREEIARLAALYPTAVQLIDAEATIAALAEAFAARPSVVHIATHGLSEVGASGSGRLRRALQRAGADDPLSRSAVLMSAPTGPERLLTARALATWDLASVRLFVLAACDSGVGLNDAAEGILGFQAALHHAGVATIMSSLWPIGDAESAVLMADFHAGLLGGRRPSAALQTAQRAAARRGDNPATWGGLVLSGVDEPLAPVPLTSGGSAEPSAGPGRCRERGTGPSWPDPEGRDTGVQGDLHT